MWPKTAPPSETPMILPTVAATSVQAMLASGPPKPYVTTPAPGAPPNLGLPDASQRARAQVLTAAAPYHPRVHPLMGPPFLPPAVASANLLQQLQLDLPPPQLQSLPPFGFPNPAIAAPGHAVPDGAPRPGRSAVDDEISDALLLLSQLWTGPSVPPLPPGGCYGGLLVSSAVSEGLGQEAAHAAAEAARELGERPVKVLLPWYPAHPGIAMFDQTKPAKITVAAESSPSPIPQ